MRKLVLATTTALAGLMAASPAMAAYTITFLEVGPDVIATGTGTLNITGLTLRTTNGDSAYLSPGRNIALIGAGNADSYFASLTYQGVLGTGGSIIRPNSSTGGIVGAQGGFNLLEVPGGYRSGAVTSGSSTFTNSTFQSLGLTRGTVTVGFNSGANADTLTFQVGEVDVPAVPEPATWAMMLLGFGMAGASMRSRRGNTSVSFA